MLKLEFFRGTKEFKIETSLDGNSWTTAVQGTLPDGQNMCPEHKILETFGIIEFQFVRFSPVSYYYLGSALSYLRPIDKGTNNLDSIGKMFKRRSCKLEL